jgi:predicted DNA-binding transcriptional regulator AlpA
MTKPKPKQLRTEPIKNGQQLLFRRQVMELVGVGSYSTLYEWMKNGDFPRPVELGPQGGRSTLIAWFAYEVHNWIATRPRRQFGQHEFRGRREDDAPQPRKRIAELPAPKPVVRGRRR